MDDHELTFTPLGEDAPADYPNSGQPGNSAQPENTNRSQRWLIGALVIVSLIALGLGIFLITHRSGENSAQEDPNPAISQAPTEGEPSTPPATAAPTATAEPTTTTGQTDPTADRRTTLLSVPVRDANSFWALGQPDAPVVITAFADYRCIHCAHWDKEVFPQLAPYLESGQVRYEFRVIPLFGPDSVPAVVAGLLAGEQGKFFEYSEELYSATVAGNAQVFTEEGLVEIATKVGLERAAFADQLHESLTLLSNENVTWADLDPMTTKISETIGDNYQLFTQLGFNGTPSFVVGGEEVGGAADFGTFKALIEQELNR